MQSQKQILGKEGEQIAEDYLKRKGYRLVARNFRCPGGELDLIVLDRKVVVFVEVKTRSDHRFGAPCPGDFRFRAESGPSRRDVRFGPDFVRSAPRSRPSWWTRLRTGFDPERSFRQARLA